MAAVVTTTTLPAWRARRIPRRIGVPCDTTAELEKGRLRLVQLTPATLTAAPLSIRLRGECIADISPDFTPPYPGFMTRFYLRCWALLRPQATAPWSRCTGGFPGVGTTG